jgi:hypothetical protein
MLTPGAAAAAEGRALEPRALKVRVERLARRSLAVKVAWRRRRLGYTPTRPPAGRGRGDRPASKVDDLKEIKTEPIDDARRTRAARARTLLSRGRATSCVHARTTSS